jgi:asparagine synthase (glutamine-hydrolysing)
MCGIFGIFAKNSNAIPDRSLVDRCTDLMTHRGPDDRGIWLNKGIALGQRRLAIIDLEHGAQPMWSGDGRFLLIYNGEVYNFKEIRRDLENHNIQFRTDCDTEVVVEAVAFWGIEALKLFNGMFAFAVWDTKTRRLLLARDRLGIKPLFYTENDRYFAFASEFPPLLKLPWIDSSLDPLGIAAYLGHYQLTFRERTVYKAIKSIEPATWLSIDDNGIRQGKYWELPRIPSNEKNDIWSDSRIEEAADSLKQVMQEAVQSHLIADVPIGAFLSGGIDSAVVTTLMAQQSAGRVKAYSIGFDRPGYCEFDYSLPLIHNLDLDHELILFDEKSYLPTMLELINHKRAPLSTPNEIPLYILSQRLSSDIKVVLSGEGSDELMGGYPPLLRSPHDFLTAQLLRLKPGSIPSDKRSALRSALREQYGKTGFKNLTDHFLTVYSWLSPSERSRILNPEIFNHQIQIEIEQYWHERLESLEQLSVYDRYLYLLLTEHLRGLLVRLDNQTMAASVEGRVPFCDNRLVEFVWSLPFEYKLRWKDETSQSRASCLTSLQIAEEYDVAKYLLKTAFRGVIPDPVIQRRKKAFPVPLESIINSDVCAGFSEYIEHVPEISQYFQQDQLKAWIGETAKQKNGELKIWMVMNLAFWLDTSEQASDYIQL